MKDIKQAVILAGGQGKRLRPFTLKNPKPMIHLLGIPFIEHLIKLLKTNGIKEVVILTGYLGERIKRYFDDNLIKGVKIKYSYTPFKDKGGEELMSGIRIKNAQNLLDNFFLLLYCDNYWPFNFKELVSYYNLHPSDVLVTVYSNLDKSTKLTTSAF